MNATYHPCFAQKWHEGFFPGDPPPRKLKFATGFEEAVWMILGRTRPRRWGNPEVPVMPAENPVRFLNGGCE